VKKAVKILPFLPALLLLGCTGSPDHLTESDLQTYYATAQQNLLIQGKMRTDTAPADAPFSYSDLVRDFTRIALYNEYGVRAGRYIARQSPGFLRRWNGPVRVAVIAGPSVPSVQATMDKAEVATFANRLSRLSGLNIDVGPREGANVLVLYLDDSEQKAFATRLPTDFPRADAAVIDAFANSPLETFCAAYAFPSIGDPGVFDFALILIKAEHGDLMRRSCIHEEITQALGLTNDSPESRPSIFNDDEEFALLTLHDEILLKMLYDPRLKAGMRATDAIPLLPMIARDAARALGASN